MNSTLNSEDNEINYIANVSEQLNISSDEFKAYLLNKPFKDNRRGCI